MKPKNLQSCLKSGWFSVKLRNSEVKRRSLGHPAFLCFFRPWCKFKQPSGQWLRWKLGIPQYEGSKFVQNFVSLSFPVSWNCVRVLSFEYKIWYQLVDENTIGLIPFSMFSGQQSGFKSPIRKVPD